MTGSVHVLSDRGIWLSEDISESVGTKRGSSDVVFKEWCTTVWILPMQERSRKGAVVFGQ